MEKDLSFLQTILGLCILLSILWLGKTTQTGSSMDYFQSPELAQATQLKKNKTSPPGDYLPNQLVRATLFMPFPLSLGQTAYGRTSKRKQH